MQCPECGKRALNIATRCPHCAHEFVVRPDPLPSPTPDVKRYVAPLAAVAAVIALGALGMVVINRTRERAPAAATTVTATRPEPETAIAEAAEIRPERRIARTWTNVRTRRTTRADVAGVLLPGDTVLVDSLARGWWRVTLEGEVVGYAHRSTLDTEPSPP